MVRGSWLWCRSSRFKNLLGYPVTEKLSVKPAVNGIHFKYCKTIFFAAIYFRVFICGDIFTAIYFCRFQKQENNFRDFIMLWPIKCLSPVT